MEKLVLDSDAWIKLCKSGLLNKVCESFECIMPAEVYEEAITAGLRDLRKDAVELETIVMEKRVRLAEKKQGQREKTLGKGEASVLDFCLKTNTVAVSDDLRFLVLLTKKQVSFHTPASLIVRMYREKIIDRKTALGALDKLKLMTRRSVFEMALKELEAD